MSFWDVSHSPGTSTPPPQTSGQSPPTLNEEVTEVIGQLGRFWGGFRKQGQTAIQAARKDLGNYLNVLFDSASTATLPGPQQEQPQQQQEQAQSPNSEQTLFTRLQSSLPPDLITSIRDTIPDSVRHPQGRIDLAHAAQARVQDAAARGEELLRGASIFLRDAVRVVPPEQAISSPSASAAAPTHEGAAKPRGTTPATVAVSSTPATRRDALLHALRANPAILRVDPANEERSAVLFAAWVATAADATRDESRRESELAADDETLGVPEELSEDEFWTRYFFRVHQIDQEDERRKAVLSGPTDQDDDFSWEDEDEDTAARLQPSPPAPPTAAVLNDEKRLNAPAMSGTTSPQRSDSSFDLVSSSHTSVAGDTSATHVSVKETSDGDDDEGDDDEEEEEDEEESDWE
ncbi:hypothetical protein BC826DRAFT_1023951 [Russula brevipes]|nr:hypothetical protein BC826DRAFT_1023951 [Russula brevipes]